ncbi:hypothetical protein DFH28DRAFT_1127222 [Melampsora americana]|nr:hypothetical protein DFH28DRAFT_1127222 [Melampsora americana]
MSFNTNDSTSNGFQSGTNSSSAPTSSIGTRHSVANLTDTSNEIEVVSPARLASERAAFRHQIRVDPAHRNMDYRSNQAHAIENARRAIEDARSVRRSSFIQAAAAGRQALQPHHDPHLDHRGSGDQAVPRVPTNISAQHYGAPVVMNLDNLFGTPVHHGSQRQLPSSLPESRSTNQPAIPSTPTVLPVNLVRLGVFHEAYLWGPKDIACTSTGKSKRSSSKEGWNLSKTNKATDNKPNNHIVFDSNHTTAELVINLMITL